MSFSVLDRNCYLTLAHYWQGGQAGGWDKTFSGEDMYNQVAVLKHALISVWWKLLPHPCPLLTRWAGQTVGLNLRPHDNRYLP